MDSATGVNNIPLVSVDEHNERRRKERQELEDRMNRTGVACPKCGEELRWETGVFFQTSQYPPPTTIPANCKKCGLTIRLER